MVLCQPGIVMQALSAPPKQQTMFKAVHGHIQQQLIAVIDAQGLALSITQQHQIISVIDSQ